MKPLYLEFIKYLTLSKRAELVATECKTCPGSIADVLSVERKGVYEYELKESMNDYHNETKKSKHRTYAQFKRHKRTLPQYFTLVIPIVILEFVERMPEINPKYGIMTHSVNAVGQMKFKYHREPKRLNTGNSGTLRKEILRKMVHDHVQVIERYQELIDERDRYFDDQADSEISRAKDQGIL